MTRPEPGYLGPLFPEGEEILVTDSFSRSLEELSAADRARVLKQVGHLVRNRHYPSLQLHPLHGVPEAWDCYVSDRLRMVVSFRGSEVRLWEVGRHEIIDRICRVGRLPRARFQPLLQHRSPPAEAARKYEPPPPREEAAGPFAAFPDAYLRILGVPRHLVKAVRRAGPEQLAGLDGLPSHTRQWLVDIATSPAHAEVLCDPSRLVYRTTLDRLTGFCEGKIRRLMLNLTPDQERCVRLPEGTFLVKGCAGSGKTTVAIYRAIELATAGHTVLVLTFNRTLAAAIRSLIEDYCGPLPPEITVETVYQLVGRLLARRGITTQLVEDGQRRLLIAQARAEARKTHRHAVLEQPVTFFRDEIERVIKGCDLATLEDYLAVERYGRRTALGPGGRRAVWRVYEVYQEELEGAGLADWADLPRLLLREIKTGGPPVRYDQVVVDESQDLTVAQIRVIQALAGGERAPSLMLLGDAAQTIYSRGYSWKQAGLDVRGHVFTLTRNHRNSRQIAQAADRLLEHQQAFRQSGEYVRPEQTTREGPRPIVLRAARGHRPCQAVRERILDLVGDQAFRPSDIAILCPSVRERSSYAAECERASLPYQCYDPERERNFELLEDKIKVLTIHAAKGIEFPVVFVTGVTLGTLPSTAALRLWDDGEDRQLELEHQRTLLYVAMTRAAECLFLVTEEGRESPFLGELEGLTLLEPYPREPDKTRGGRECQGQPSGSA